MASRYLRKQQQLQRRLAGDLVLCQTDIDPETENHETAVEFCVSNFADHTFLDPTPIQVDERYAKLVEKLENHSVHEKVGRLRACVARLKELNVGKGEYDEAELLAGKMLFLYEREPILPLPPPPPSSTKNLGRLRQIDGLTGK